MLRGMIIIATLLACSDIRSALGQVFHEGNVVTDVRERGYPWRTFGRIETAAGFGTGQLVGPCHILTNEHVLLDSKTMGNPYANPTFTPLNSKLKYRIQNYESGQYFVLGGGYRDWAVAKIETFSSQARPLGEKVGWLGLSKETPQSMIQIVQQVNLKLVG